MDLRHAVRIGADQRPQCFPVLRQRPVCRNDLLLRRQQLGLALAISTLSSTPRWVRCSWACTETGNLFQLIQQRHLLEGGLHGKVQLRHAAGEIQLDSRRFRLTRIFSPMAAATRARSAPHKSIFSVAPTPTVFRVYHGPFYRPGASKSRAR